MLRSPSVSGRNTNVLRPRRSMSPANEDSVPGKPSPSALPSLSLSIEVGTTLPPLWVTQLCSGKMPFCGGPAYVLPPMKARPCTGKVCPVRESTATIVIEPSSPEFAAPATELSSTESTSSAWSNSITRK